MPPPILRIVVLISAIVLIIGLASVADSGRTLRAQTVTLVDYDTDDDGLIEIRTREQWGAMHYDLNGDGIPESRGAQYSGTDTPWATGFPNAMTAAGCPARDHDNDPGTADQASCIGYELLNDLTINSGNIGAFGEHSYQAHAFTAKFVGNGYRVHGLDLTDHSGEHNSLGAFAELDYSASVEGLGLISPNIQSGYGQTKGTITSRLRGKIIGSYTEGGWVRFAFTGGMVGTVYTHATTGYGLIAHSYVRGTRVGETSSQHGGLAATFEARKGTNSATCLNSYFSGDVDGGSRGLIVAQNSSSQGRFINCVGDSTTDADGSSTTTTAPGSNPAGTTAATNANMIAVTDYDTPTTNNPFSGWDDYPLDGTIDPLGATEPRTDAWHFGDETNLPVLKAWGHDFTLPLDRSATGSDTVNLCTRNLAVANEIIRHLKDNVRRSGVTATPAVVTNLGTCTSSTDTQSVSITNLYDLVVTTPTHTFNLNPDRTNPPADRITSLHFDDFAYLTNVAHIDLSNNDLETLPTRIFQALPLRQVNLANNRLTSLPPDLFAGIVVASSSVTDNALWLNGNSLTETGIPGKVFDPLWHMNAVDLSDNNLTRINTRWFERMAHLGRKATSNQAYIPALGLHLEGNTITAHYHSNKLFTGVTDNLTTYADVTTPTAVTAGDALRTAITAAITARAGGTTPTTLSLTGTDYFNTGASAAYTATACPTSGTAGPGRYEYLGGTEPDCYIQPHWTPPHKSTDSATATPTLTSTAVSGQTITATFPHTQATSFVAYQIRYRAPGDRWTPWLVAPITYTGTNAAKTATFSAPWRGETYTVELRARSTTGPPSAAASSNQTVTAGNWITGYDAATGTASGGIAISWNAPTGLPANHTVTAFYYRYKLRSASIYDSAWKTVPDSDDSGTAVNDETGHALTQVIPDSVYDVQLAAGIDGPDADSELDFFSNRYTDNATAYAVPSGISATTGTAPGTIRVMWTMQTVGTTASSKLQVRRKLRTTSSWTGATWIDIPDSTGTGGDAGTDAHDETEYTLTGLKAGADYDIEVRLFRSAGDGGPLQPVPTTGTASEVATPTNLRAAQGTFGNIVLTWDAQTTTTASTARYQLRYKPTDDAWPETSAEGWATLASTTHASTTTSVDELVGGISYDFQVRLLVSTAVGTSEHVAVNATPTTVLTTPAQHQRPGYVTLSWPAQTAVTASTARFQYRATWAEGGSWVDWLDVPDSGDPDSHRYDETSHTIAGYVAGRPHHYEVRFHDGTTPGPAARLLNVLPGNQPLGLTAVAGDLPGTIDLTWNPLTYTEGAWPGSIQRFDAFAKLSTATAWGTSTPIPDSNDDGTNRWDEVAYRISGLAANTLHDVRVMFMASTTDHQWPLGGDAVDYIPSVRNVRSGIVLPPTNFTATTAAAAVNGIDLKWDKQTASTAATSKHQYRIKATSTASWSTETWNDIPDGSDDSSHTYDEDSFTVTEITSGTALTANTSYDIELRFYYDSTYTNSTAVAATATSSTIPAPPNFNAEPSVAQGAADLAWELVDGATEYQQRYKTTTSGTWSNWTQVPDANSDSSFADEDAVTITGLTANTSYDFELRAHTATTSGATATTTATAQSRPAPTSVAFSLGTNPGEVDVAWAAPATGTPNGFQFRYKLAADAAYPGAWSEIPDSGTDGRGNETAYTITGLRMGTTYNLQLSAQFSGGQASLPNPATTGTVTLAPLAAPTGLAGATGTTLGEVDISWTHITTGLPTGHSIAHYQYSIKLDTEMDSAYSAWTNIPPANTSSYSIPGRASGTLYNVRIRAAVDDADADSAADYYSAASAAANARSPVDAPAGFSATAGTNPGEVDLAWTAQSGFDSTYTTAKYQYRAKRRTAAWQTTGDLGWTDISGTDHDSSSAAIVLPNGQQYDIQLRFVPNSTITSAAASDTVTTVAVSTPASFTATADGTQPSAIVLAWTAQTTGTSSEAKYQYRRKLTSGTWPGTAPFGWTDIPDSTADSDSDAHNESGLTLTSLTSGASYDIELRFHWSDAAGASTAATATQAASAVPTPTGLSTTVDYHAVTLTWTVQTTEQGTEAHYEYRAKKSTENWPATTPFGWANVPSSNHATTTYTITGLDGGNLYDIELRFHWDNTAGPSAGTATTATPTAIPAPQSLTATTPLTPRQMVVSWTEQTTITDSDAKWQIRTRAKSPTLAWSNWADVPDADTDNNLYDETTVTRTGQQPNRPYDVEVRMVVGSAEGYVGLVEDARSGHQPQGYTLTPGDTPGTLVMKWTQQSVYTGSLARFGYDYKLATASSYGTFVYIGQAGQPSSYSSTGATITGLTPGTEYDVRVAFRDASNWAQAAWRPTLRATAAVVQPPKNIAAATPTNAARAITLSWDEQTESTDNASHFEYRYKESTASSWPASWTDVADGDDANTHTYDETGEIVYGLTAGTQYDFQVRFHWNATHGESESATASATASDIPAPANFAASSGTNPGTVNLSWDVVWGINDLQYRYKLKTAPAYPTTGAGDWTDIGDSGDSGSSAGDEIGVTVTGLSAGMQYDFQVRARLSATDTSAPVTADATAQTQAAPQSFTVAAGTAAGSLDITFTAPSVGTPTRYDYRYKRASESSYPTSGAGAWAQVPDVNSNNNRVDDLSFTITSLWAGVSYNVQLTVTSAVGTSQPSTVTQTATALSAPASFTATIGTDPGEIDLSWTTISTGLPTGDSVVNYQFRTKLTSAGASTYTAWTDIAGATTSSHTITGLSSYTEYDVQLRAAVDDGGDAGTVADYHSNVATDTQTRSGLAIPANLRATSGTNPGELDLAWNAQTTFGATYTTAVYQVRSKLTTASWPTTGDLGWANISGSSRTSTSHTLTGLMAAQQYDIELRFLPNSSLTSGAASVQGTPTAVPTPTGFGAATSGNEAGAIELTWTAQTASTDANAKYQYRSKVATAAWPATTPFGWNDVPDSTGTGGDADTDAHNESAFRVTGLSAGLSHNIELRFHWSDAVGPSAAVSRTANASTIPTPGSFSASTGSGPGEIDLTWAAVVNATYQVRTKLSTAADSTYSAWSASITGTTHTVTGLTNAQTYTIQLRANVTGVTGSSPVTTATAQAQSQPGPQMYTTAQGTNAGEISMSWTAPSGGTVVEYEYRYKLATDAAYPADGATGGWNHVPDGSDSDSLRSNETGFVITSLLGGLSYNVQLRVETTAGHSLPATSTRTATPVAAPGSFTAARGTDPGAIDLTWSVIATTAMPTNDSVVQYQFRTKLSSAGASTYTAWTNIAGATTTSYTVTGLAAYTLHDIQLRAAIDDGGDADSLADYHSSAATQSGIRTGLAVPADLRATPGTNPGQVNLNWTAQTTFTSGSFPNAEYEFRTKLTSASWPTTGDLGWTDITGSSVSTGSHTISNLLNGQQHDIQLRFLATSSLFSAGAAVQATPTPIAVPSGLQATTAATTSGAIDLDWDPQSAITVSTAQFQYRTKLTSAAWTGVTWNPIPDSTGTGGDADTDAHNEDEYTITGLTADAQYDVQLRLFMSAAVGASNPATSRATASRVPVPTGFNATTGSGAGEIDLSWTAVMGATDYQYRCSQAASGCPNTWSTAITGTTYTITNLTGGAFYNIQLRARVTGIGESAPTSSQRAQAQTTPGPASLTFSHGPAPGDIKLDWTAPAMNAPVEHYEYRYKLETASDSAYSAWAEVMDSTDAGTSQADETTITISDLQAGVSYHVQFRVYASDAIQYSLPQRGTQAARPVPPPTAFTATGGTNPGEVTLGWTAPAGVTILRYELRHRLGTTGDWSSWVSAATATSYTYTGLLAGASRTFQLRAVMQTVGASAPVSVTGTPTPVPTPTGFMASTGTFPGEINLTWGAVTGATSYQYRYEIPPEPPATTPTWSDWQTPNPALSLAVTLTQLAEGESYDAEVRALITNVGTSSAAAATANARGATFADPDGTPAPPTGDNGYSISATALPGRITIKIPAGGDPFIYRHRTTNPGEWSPWMKVTPEPTQTQFHPPIRDFTPGIRYDIQVRVYTVATSTFTTALMSENTLVLALKPAENFGASETSGVILLEWDSPMQYQPDSYQYRTRPTGTAEWGDWVTVMHAGAVGSKQRHYVSGLDPGISHDFQLIMRTGEVATDPTEASATARLRIAEVHSITPVVREVSIRAGETIALTVDIYDTQQVIDNSIPAMPNSKLVIRWTELEGSGGSFGTPNNERRVSYTAPSSPGRYTIQAEAQPDGVCTSHHEGESEISVAERAQCQAIFTIRVTAAPTVAPPRPDPVNPTGSIPTSMTDSEGTSYAVVTPADGGTFTGTDITITAPEGAVPDRTIIGITAAVSDIQPPAPIPGATLSVAGRYYEINALQESGDPPLQSYTLRAPVTACLPFPDEFRATLSNVVLIQRTPDGNLSPLSTKIRTQNGALSVCGTISALPATVAVARLGLVPAATIPTPAPDQPLPDTGGTAPSATVAVLILLTGILLTGLTQLSTPRKIRQD